MKLTKTKLKQIIREEIQKLDEFFDMPKWKKGDVELHPKQRKSLGVVGNLKQSNKVLKALQDWSKENIQFDD